MKIGQSFDKTNPGSLRSTLPDPPKLGCRDTSPTGPMWLVHTVVGRLEALIGPYHRVGSPWESSLPQAAVEN